MSEKVYLQNKRTIFDLTDEDVDRYKLSVGFIIYFIIFVLLIPHFLIKNGNWDILAAYFPNLDLMATVVGYHGGPINSFIWKHLYNPVTNTIPEYISGNIINYFALLGVTYIVAYYTFINKNI